MENVDRMLNIILTDDDEELVAWRKQIVPAARYDFGPFNDLPKVRSLEEVFAQMEKEPDIFALPSTNCLFYCNDLLFYHVMATGNGTVEGRAVIVDENGDFLFCPLYMKADFPNKKLHGYDFLKKYPDGEGRVTLTCQLFFFLTDFLRVLHKQPELVKEINLMQRSLTLRELSVFLETPLADLERRAEEEHWICTEVSLDKS